MSFAIGLSLAFLLLSFCFGGVALFGAFADLKKAGASADNAPRMMGAEKQALFAALDKAATAAAAAKTALGLAVAHPVKTRASDASIVVMREHANQALRLIEQVTDDIKNSDREASSNR